MYANPYTKRVFTRCFCCLSELIAQLIKLPSCTFAVAYACPDYYHDFFYIYARYSIQWRERRLKIRWLRLILIGGVVENHLLHFKLANTNSGITFPSDINIPRNRSLGCARYRVIIYKFANRNVFFFLRIKKTNHIPINHPIRFFGYLVSLNISALISQSNIFFFLSVKPALDTRRQHPFPSLSISSSYRFPATISSAYWPARLARLDLSSALRNPRLEQFMESDKLEKTKMIRLRAYLPSGACNKIKRRDYGWW